MDQEPIMRIRVPGECVAVTASRLNGIAQSAVWEQGADILKPILDFAFLWLVGVEFHGK